MSEHLPEHSRDIERVELDIAPFTESWETREDAIWELSEFTRRANVELGKRGVYLALTNGTAPVDREAESLAASRPSDEELINQAILDATRLGEVIDDAAARVIASQLHGGQDTELYAFASMGVITSNLLLDLELIEQDGTIDPLARSWVHPLRKYIKQRSKAGAVEHIQGWGSLWLGEAPQGEEAVEYEREQREKIEELEADILRRERDNAYDRNVIAHLKRNVETVRQGGRPVMEPVGAEMARAIVLAMHRKAEAADPTYGPVQQSSIPNLSRAFEEEERLKRIRERAEAMVREEYGDE